MPGKGLICLLFFDGIRAADFVPTGNLLDSGELFAYPSISDFFTSATAECMDICDIYLVALALSADDNTLVAEYTMPAYMSSDDAKKVKPLLRKLVYRWNGERFVID